VKDTIRWVVQHQVWVEVVTLVFPGFNDSDAELRAAAEFLASVSPDIPWHVTAFHPDYKMNDGSPTSATTLLQAVEHARAAGLRYVYAGNLPGRVAGLENTYCPSCRAVVIERLGYRIRAVHLQQGRCQVCDTAIPGRWGDCRAIDQAPGAWIPRAVALWAAGLVELRLQVRPSTWRGACWAASSAIAATRT
jgi:pyruvate formate lyase activating enzyme